MTAKQALILLLVIFTGSTLFYFVVQMGDPAPVLGYSGVQSQRTADGDSKIIAYYFHVTTRCDTCRKIERYSEEAIRQNFAKQIEEGKLAWRPVNVQLQENRHFVKKYKLYTRSLVYVLVENGIETKHKNLASIWQLVNSESNFKRYVTNEMNKYLRRLE